MGGTCVVITCYVCCNLLHMPVCDVLCVVICYTCLCVMCVCCNLLHMPVCDVCVCSVVLRRWPMWHNSGHKGVNVT